MTLIKQALRVKASSRVRKTDGVVISPARLAVITVLLLVTTGLSTAGLISSIQRKEALNTALKPENIQTTIRAWLDAFGYGSSVGSDPNSEFLMTVNMPASGKHVTIVREKAFIRYIAVIFSLVLSPDDQTAIAKLSENERSRLFLDLKIELDRAGADGFSMGPGQITYVKRIPVTNSLTEDVLIRTINSAEASEDLIVNVMAKDLIR